MDQFERSITQEENGQYKVALPWKPNRPPLKHNYAQAKTRLEQVERRLKKNRDMQREYSKAINTYEDEGTSEECPPDEVKPKDKRQVYYVPHHVVVQLDRETTKHRIVFDVSAKSEDGISLNDCLEKGPVLQPEISTVLVCFRQHPVAIMADIRKMYLQALLKEADRDLFHYLWRDMNTDIAHV